MKDYFSGTENYVATDELALAVNAAITLERPLLIKGEPGTGKTLSAILASRVIDSKLTLILCPNHIVKQWIRNIQATLGEKFAHTTPKLIKLGNYDELDGKPQDAFHIKADKSKHQYLVINYDQLNLPGTKSKELVLKLGKQKLILLF